jgi:hypothetical protein
VEETPSAVSARPFSASAVLEADDACSLSESQDGSEANGSTVDAMVKFTTFLLSLP